MLRFCSLTAVLGLFAAAVAGGASAAVTVRCVASVDAACQAGYGTIQAAVDASSAGDTILVGPGTYNETVQIPAAATGLSLLGAQEGVDARGRKFKAAHESVVTAAAAGSLNAGFIVRAQDVTIDGFTITGATDPGNGSAIDLKGGANPASGAAVLDNILIGNSQAVSINFEGAANPSDIFIGENSFRNNNVESGDGVYTSGCSRVQIDRNEFTGTPTAAVGINNCTDVTVTNNTSVGDGTFAILTGTSRARISDNSVKNAGTNPTPGAGGAAIAVGPSNSRLTIVRNTIKGAASPSFRGIAFTSIFGAGATTNVLLQGNSVSKMTASGIIADLGMLTGSRLFSNTSVSNGVNGISLASGNTGNVLKQNIAKSNAGFDCFDASTGGGTLGTANTWLHNRGKASMPIALCK